MKLKSVGKRILSTLLAFALTVSAMPAGQLVSFAEDAPPFIVTENYEPDENHNDLGLDEVPGMERFTVHKPVDGLDVNNLNDDDITDDTFVNGVVITEFQGKLYCQWQSSNIVEDDRDGSNSTVVVYSVSADNGKSWTAPQQLSPVEDDPKAFYSSGGWHTYDNTGDGEDDVIVAYLNYWYCWNDSNEDQKKPTGGKAMYVESEDGSTWSGTAKDVTMSDGSTLYGIFEQDPHVLDNGRIVNSAHFQTTSFTEDATNGGLNVWPIYTDDMSGVSGWKTATTFSEDSGCLEPSMFVNSDGHIVMTFRSGNNKVYASLSEDNGVTWTDPVATGLADPNQKQSAGNLPDGTAFIVNCPTDNNTKVNRFPLAITLSSNGERFTKAYVIGLGTDEALGEIKYLADGEDGTGDTISYKRLGYHYPKSKVIGNYLYISYAKNKEEAEIVRIPLESISLNDGWREYKKESSTYKYYAAYDMTYENENGYIISRRGLGSIKNSLGIDTSLTDYYKTYALNATDTTGENPINGEYFSSLNINAYDTEGNELDNYWSGTIEGENANSSDAYVSVPKNVIWYIDGSNSGHIYCKVGDTRYYLYRNNTAIGITNKESEASTWFFSWPTYEDGLEDNELNSYKLIYTVDTINNITYYLSFTGNSSADTNTKFSLTTLGNDGKPVSAASLGVYTLETTTTYTSLTGQLNYDIKVGTELSVDDIKSVAYLSTKEINTKKATEPQMNPTLLSDLSNVECVWEDGKTLDVNTPGIYRLVVEYDDKEVGVITVNVNANVEEPEWTKVSSNVTYTLTNTMEPDMPYLIGNWYKAIDNEVEGDHILLSNNTDLTVKPKDSGYVTDSYTNNTAIFENVSENEIWKKDSYGKLYNSPDGINKQYLVMDENYSVFLSDTGSDTVWTISPYKTDTNNILFSTEINEKTVYLCGGDTGYSGKIDGENDTYGQDYGRATLWALSGNYTYAYIGGKADYTIESSSTEEFESAIIAGNETKVYTKVVDVNGTEGSITEVSLGDSNIDFNWTNSGNIWTAEISYLGTPLGNVTVTGEEESVTSDYSASLSGKLSYSIYESETLTTEDIKKAAFVNVTPTGGTTDKFDLTSEGVQCVWNKTYNDTPTAGTYTMTVLYNGESVGQITVEVKGLSSAWVDVETDTLKGTYEVVYSMDHNNTDGYLITRRGVNAGSKHSLSVSSGKNSPFDTVTAVNFLAYGEDKDTDYRYAIVNSKDVSSNNLWFIDKDDHIYSKGSDGTVYYLNIDTTNSFVKYTNDSSTAPKWTVDRYNGNDTDAQIYNGKYYLQNNGNKNEASSDIATGGDKGYFNYKLDNERVIIWALEYEEGQAALSGTTVYDVLVGDSSVNVSTIQKNAYVLLKKNELSSWTYSTGAGDDGKIDFEWTKPDKVDWSDPNITFSWNQAFNTNVAGTYIMTVKYNGTPVGTITVNVGDVTWTDITDYTYQRTTEIEPGKYYIITDSSIDDDIDNSSATTTKGLATGFNPNNVKDSWSSAIDVNIVKNTDGNYSIKTTDGATLTEAFRWHVDSSYYMYTVLNGRSYYLRGENAAEDSITRQIRVNIDYSAAASWNAAPSGTTDKTNFTTTVDNTTRYLSYTSRSLFQSITDATTVTLYTPVSSQINEVAMAGEKEYTVIADNNNMSETYIKAKTNFYLKTTNTDGTYTLDRIPWTGEDGLTYEWSATALDGVTQLTDSSGNPITVLDANTEGIYTMTVRYEGKVVGTVTVNVKKIKEVSYSGAAWIGVGKGQEPNLSSEKLTVTYTDGTTDIVTIADGVSISGYDTTVPAEHKADIKYLDYEFEDILTIYVWDDAFAGLSDATDYPKYPEEGSVRLNKTATNDSTLSWYGTGVTKVELDVAGTSVRSGVDVILVSDVSNSMGRKSADESEVGEKLRESMDAASNLADILLKDNNKNNNSISFVTFGGYDADNCQKPVDNRIDATTTVFVYEQDVDRAKTSFSNTRFITYGYRDEGGNKYPNGDDAWLQIYDNNGNPTEYSLNENGIETAGGTNSGGTNYDYAFAEAINAVAELKVAYSKANNNASYDDSGRQIVLLFMTDGAPTYYNYEGVDIGTNGSENYLYGTKINYPPSMAKFYPGVDNNIDKDSDVEVDGVTKTAAEWWNERSTNWYNFTNNPNEYAIELNSLVDAFYAVGFKMSDDLGKSKHCYNWNENNSEKFINVLSGLAGVEAGKQAVDGVLIAEDTIALSKAYVEMTEQVISSGTYATINDIIKWEFSLVMDDYVTDINNNDTTVEPVIEIKKYDLDSNGERTGTPEILERVNFEVAEDGKISAHSNQIYETDDNGDITSYPDIIQGRDDETDTDGMFKIVGKYFTYTNANNGNYEFFDWDIQTIAGYEYALSYYVSLRGTNSNYQSSSDGSFIPGNNVYDTNTEAKITYVDINGDKAVQTFDKPKKPWGKAVTTVEYYLVDTDGNPVDRAGKPVNFDNRIKVSEATHSHEINWNEPTTIKGELHAPAGYVMYNQAAYYTVEVNVDKNNNMTGSFVIVDEKTITNSNEITTKRSDYNPENNYEATIVSFGVYSSGKSPLIFNKDQIVIDYGKAIQVDVLENDNLANGGEVTIGNDTFYVSLVGLSDYVNDSIYTEYIQGSSGTTEPLPTTGGVFTLIGDGESVQFKPNAMVSEVQRVFAVARLTNKNNSSDLFYLYQELDVIPATVMYYETNFADYTTTVDGTDVTSSYVFTNSQVSEGTAWGTKYDAETTMGSMVSAENSNDNVQNAVEIGADRYGYDTTYIDDNMLSDGNSLYVEGKGATATTSTFTFTGTGFDIISHTGEKDGMIRVQIYKAGTTDKVKTISVLNKAESAWGELYQIPVVSCEGLPYGSYDVKIGVMAEANGSIEALNRGNKFYFDAVRIYNPLGNTSDDGSLPGDTDSIGLNAYLEDGEYKPNIQEVRHILIDSKDFDVDGTSKNSGVLFIERFDTDDFDDSDEASHNYNISQYDEIGPNNEAYLSEGQAIVFKLTGIDTSAIASIDIGAKSVDGSTVTMKAVIANDTSYLDSTSNDKNAVVVTETIKTCTSQYYDLYGTYKLGSFKEENGTGSAYIYIANVTEQLEPEEGSELDKETDYQVLSITDIKVAYGAGAMETAATTLAYTVNNSLVDFANVCYELTPDYDVESATFIEKQIRIFGNTNMVIETSQFVESLNVTDRFGRPIDANTEYVDKPNGIREWTITLMVTKLGEQTYKVIGYGADGISGETAETSVLVIKEEGGGWQNAKSIYKTLFNCRILSIKRGTGSRL